MKVILQGAASTADFSTNTSQCSSQQSTMFVISFDETGEKQFYYNSNYLAHMPEVTHLIGQEEMGEYKFRGKLMKRAPKKEYYIPNEEPPTYKWGQQKINYPGGDDYSGEPMPPWMIKVKDKINVDFKTNVNHAIIIKYSDGVLNHAPPHQDKIPEGTDFFVLSFGEPRKFQLTKSEKTNTGKRKQDGSVKYKCVNTGVVEWEQYLASGSLLQVTNLGNKKYFHAVPKDKAWSGTARYSLIFRTIF